MTHIADYTRCNLESKIIEDSLPNNIKMNNARYKMLTHDISDEDREYTETVAKFLSKFYMHSDAPYGGVCPLPQMRKVDWTNLQEAYGEVIKYLKVQYESGLWNEVGQFLRLNAPPKGHKRPHLGRVTEILTYKLFARPVIAIKSGTRKFLYS